ncbi:Tim44 domain-containing protein [Beggiatoa leptomitoformis]|uniref:Tim44-like domain-containing protein n=1 Tax=Beggiatoa leptomitoformis TaxID=288004 RepID=A0A2N9YCG1_9GAMM|nr:Tim44-like domain-containing protein [Beggiatoa leptomitoformis]ALG66552.1 hypothetical protein AL038_00865 [Beggiatoa leptomitoformis]AUI68149.1 hypothetical protein BLE401_05180 [Beggiatoa leptomitoformis]
MKRWLLITLVSLVFLTLLAPINIISLPNVNRISLPVLGISNAEARPGGGSSFRSSGSRRSSSSSRSSGRSSGFSWGSNSSSSGGYIDTDLDVTELLVIIFIILIIIIIHYYSQQRDEKRSQRVVSSKATRENLSKKQVSIDKRLDALRQRDLGFSRVLFLDFVHSLYHKYYSYRGTSDMQLLTPYFSKGILSEANQPQYKNQQVSEIVVGSLNIIDVGEWTENEGIKVEIEANYTINYVDKKQIYRHLVKETWFLVRRKGVQSSPPEKMRSITCPQCGAPAHFNEGGQCEYCETVIHRGTMQWMLDRRMILENEQFKAALLGTYAEEEGTELATIRQADLAEQQNAFVHARNLSSWDDYWRDFQTNIVKTFFLAIYAAWTAQNWKETRHLLSDRLYETNDFWIQQYKAQGLVNRLEKITIQKVILVKIECDYYYEAITVRIYASCYDYVTDKKGSVIGRSKNTQRKFTEYWTFIRRAGIVKPEGEFDLHSCPSCGAPLDKMSMAAECGYCGSKVSTGDFSWVLSLITQDEVYQN